MAIQPILQPEVASARYAAYEAQIKPGVRRYNVFWQPFESSGLFPSTTPLSCPAGYQQVCMHAAGIMTASTQQCLERLPGRSVRKRILICRCPATKRSC